MHPDLQPGSLQDIFDAHQKISFKKGDFLLKEGETANEYYCLNSGMIRSYAINTKDKDITTGFFGANDIVIEVASLFLRVPTKENIQTLTDCECWKIDLESFQRLFHSIEGFSEWGRAWMTGSLFQLKQRSLAMITASATERYLSLQQQHPQILQHAPLKHIASYLGVTDTSLSRIRKEVTRP